MLLERSYLGRTDPDLARRIHTGWDQILTRGFRFWFGFKMDKVPYGRFEERVDATWCLLQDVERELGDASIVQAHAVNLRELHTAAKQCVGALEQDFRIWLTEDSHHVRCKVEPTFDSPRSPRSSTWGDAIPLPGQDRRGRMVIVDDSDEA